MNKAYKVPMRALWLTQRDEIEIRVLTGCRPDPEKSVRHWINIHLGDRLELLGISVIDSRNLRLGQWLRQNWEEIPADGSGDDGGLTLNQVAYDEAGQIAYFGLVGGIPEEVHDPAAGAEVGNVVQRRSEIRFAGDGTLCSIRIPVVTRRRQDGDLSATVGYLPQR